MLKQTATKTERFARTRRRLLLGVLGVFAVLGAVVALAVATGVPVTAATSSTINFQARLETNAGSIAADGNYNVEFKLYDLSTSSGSSQGSCTGDADCLWTETRTGANQVHVTNGYLTVNLGSVTAFPSTVTWNQQLYLTMNIGGTGGSPTWDGEMSPRLKLTAVPYAFQAGALSATSGANIGKLSFGSITGTDTITLPDASGTVCLQTSSACGFATGTGSAFLQGGNSFGAQGVLGTNDGNSLAIRTNNTNKLVIDTSGNLQLQQASTFSIASATTGSQLTIQAGGATGAGNNGGNLLLQGGAGGSGATTGSVIVKANGSDSTGAFQIQNSSSVALLTADTSNSTVTLRAGSDHATLGSELYSGTFSSGWTTTGWTIGGGGTTATHNTGTTNALINSSVAITSGATYKVSFVQSGSCPAGTESATVTIGGTVLGTLNSTNCNGGTYTYVATASSTAGLTFAPTSTWNATVSSISIMQLTGTINPVLRVQNTSGSANLEVRASAYASNLFVGLSSGSNTVSASGDTAVGAFALQHEIDGGSNVAVGTQALQGNTAGNDNVAVGPQALYANISGALNVAVGSSALNNNITGSQNTALGYAALKATQTGDENTGIGFFALVNNTTGTGHAAVGYQALKSITTGSSDSALGYNAGYQDSNGSFSTLAALQNATAIGAYGQVQANNSIVLGSVDNATKVGIGITVPSNTFSVSPLDYQTGTATRTNSSATLVGTGTTWTSSMVGDLIVFADGTTNTVSAFTDATHITMGTTYTGTTDAAPTSYRFHHPGFQVTNAGNTAVQNTSTTAFQVQNASGTAVLTTDTLNQAVTVRAGSDHATLGSELYSGTFSSGWATTGWDVSGITTAVHNTGNTNALINSSVPITSGATYRVSVTLSGTCTSTITGTIGGTQFTSINGGGNDYCTAGYTYTYVATATNTAGLTFTPDTSWAGTISNVSIKQLTGTITPALSIQNASGTANLEVRASSTTTNLFIGANSGALNATGFQNTAVGGNSLQSNISGGWNAAFGSGALLKNTTGSDNSAFGYSSLAGNVTGTDNAAFGYQALMGNIGGTANSAFGSGALQTNISGHNNTAVGASALGTTFTGNFNTAVGDSALYQNRSGSRNAAFGSSTLGSNTSGTNNSAFGYDALASTTTGSNNVAFGDFSLEWNTSGSGNTALGHYAGFQDSGGSFSTLATLQNATAIGAYAQVQASYSIVLGSVDTATNVGIGTTVPLNRFSVSPLDYQTGTVTRTNGSATLVGTGTTWGSFAAGDLIVFADGTTNTVSTVTDATHITMGSPYSGTTDASPVSYRFHRPGFQVTALGNAYVQNTSTTAFQVQTSSGTALLTADTSGSQISVGGNLNVTGSKSVFSAAATATGTNGVLNLGPGGFGGGGGNFAGSSSGTLLALNGASGFSGNLADLQVNGTSQFKVDASGNLTITGNVVAPGPANIFGTSAGSSSSSGKISVGAGGFSGGAGNFVGSGGGTEIAINATSSWTGNLVDFQVNGASRFLIDPNGQVVVNAPASYTGTLLSLKLNGTSVFAVGSTGHLISAGTAPTVAVSGANDCNSGATIPATASLTSATDTKGIVNLTTGNGGGCFNGGVAAVTFATAYAATPVIVLTPMTLDGAAKGPFVFFASTTGFSVCLATAPAPSTTYQFAYEVVQ